MSRDINDSFEFVDKADQIFDWPKYHDTVHPSFVDEFTTGHCFGEQIE